MIDETTQNATPLDEKAQKELNTPLADPTGVNAEDQKFLQLIVSLINEGKINLYQPDTLINHDVYDKLTEEKKGKADLEAINMLAAIREIKDLYDHGFRDSYQIQNSVQRLRYTKERLEIEGGDLFII